MAGFLRFLIGATLLAVTACGSPQPKAPAISREVQTERYVRNLALLQLTLERASADSIAAKTYVKSLNGYSASNKKNAKNIGMRSVLLDYKTESGKNTLVVPVPQLRGHSDFTALRSVTALLGGSYTLRGVKAYVLHITPSRLTAFPAETADWSQEVQQHQSVILESTAALAEADNARLQLELVRFFMQQRMRDAAYLAMENAKEALASLSQSGDVAALSKEASALENTLHQTLPYKL